ncbi:MAG: uracil-DNA glycosylase [Sphingobacteriaceae bacterium]|nr:uracil-DNA glycosylase [Sphingobacteriaceae bacterium]
MNYHLDTDWQVLLKDEFIKDYFIRLCDFLDEERENYKIYPEQELVFSAFNRTKPTQIKVVILGQDPYHGIGQANGLCFSVNDGMKMPPSLVNIFKELKTDIGCDIPITGNLEHWADQGVFLLNSVLTVRKDNAGSHQKKGWEQFTDQVINIISAKYEGIIFMLWGNYAKEKAVLIDHNKHLVLQAAHPSPLARGAYFGSKHFSKANVYLNSIGKSPVNWCF